MNRELIYINKISETYYDPDNRVISYIYSGIMDRKITEVQLRDALDFLEDKTVYGIYLDIRYLMGSFLKLFEYLQKVYYPFMLVHGLCCKVIVVSDDLITSHLTELLYDMLCDLGIKVRVFKNPTEAEKWLDEVLAKKIPSE